MVKNKSMLAIKLFIIVWVVLAVHIALKLTFNYWQPYVIPNEQLQTISDFIDDNRWIKNILDFILCFINVVFVCLTSIQRWKFKNKYPYIIIFICIIISFFTGAIIDSIITIIMTILLPLFLDYKKWKSVILTFIFSNIFLFLSLWLEGFVSGDDMQYICKVFLEFDYYIMLALNYFVFNLIRKKK